MTAAAPSVSEQGAPESQVGIQNSEARIGEDSFFGADGARKLTVLSNRNHSRYPAFRHRSQEELVIAQDIFEAVSAYRLTRSRVDGVKPHQSSWSWPLPARGN